MIPSIYHIAIRILPTVEVGLQHFVHKMYRIAVLLLVTIVAVLQYVSANQPQITGEAKL